jgi:2-keto-4-pentenoate hydratase/2-oxohepta-3-ene-1,7-dioic acid hydratase in catechol pathway
MDKLICVGKNYLDHARELGEPVPEKPVFFLKPPSSVKMVRKDQETTQVKLPKNRGTIHPECEIILKLGHDGSPEWVSLGLDMTLRDVQMDLKKKGHPWEISKVFEDSAVIGPWISLTEYPEFLDNEFTLTLDGVLLQKAKGREMRLSPLECLKYAKDFFPLCEGDILFTGTPAGVAPVNAGQTAELRLGSKIAYRVTFI